jgi:hypothetical protein
MNRHEQHARVPVSPVVALGLLLLLAAGWPAVGETRHQGAEAETLQTAAFDHTYRRWAALLEYHVFEDRLDYAGLRRDHAELRAALAELEAVTPADMEGWTRAQRFAFWVNAYNLACVALVVEGYPIASINDLSKPDDPVWDRPAARLGAHLEGAGTHLSLNQIEHELIRPRFADARIHAALNCASIGCPPLAVQPYRAEQLEQQLDTITGAFLGDRERNRFEPAAGRVHLSKVFEWFPEDFAAEEGGLSGFLNRHAPQEAHGPWLGSAELRFLEWDWALNDLTEQQRRRRAPR